MRAGPTDKVIFEQRLEGMREEIKWMSWESIPFTETVGIKARSGELVWCSRKNKEPSRAEAGWGGEWGGCEIMEGVGLDGYSRTHGEDFGGSWGVIWSKLSFWRISLVSVRKIDFIGQGDEMGGYCNNPTQLCWWLRLGFWWWPWSG